MIPDDGNKEEKVAIRSRENTERILAVKRSS
jgi:hypothetical protein